MYHICQTLTSLSTKDEQKLQVALAFHDLGLFTENTVDYLPPSMALADDYLKEHHLQKWQKEIALMIGEHHKITPYQTSTYPLVELLRRADLVDFSLGLVRHGVDRAVITQLKQEFPNAGFHKMVVKEQLAWITSHPKNPFPIFKL